MNIIDKSIDYLQAISKQTGSTLYLDELPRLASDIADLGPSSTKENVQAKPNNAPKFQPIAPKESIKEEVISQKAKEAPQKAEVIAPKASHTKIATVSSDWQLSNNLDELRANICDCMNCTLGATRNKFVFGVGNPNADIMIIGEAPGADEDAQGEPFVGRAGQLLTKILEAINFSRDQVFIGNIIKCRPPANRRPSTPEVAECEPYLKKQIDLIKPKFILALGLTAADTLFKKPHKMADVRGKLFDYNGIQTMITYHPAALLRNPNWKKFVWEDVQLLRKLYDESKSK